MKKNYIVEDYISETNSIRIYKLIQKEIKRTIKETRDEDDYPTDELSEGIIQGLQIALTIIERVDNGN